jgi:hypothetical protein
VGIKDVTKIRTANTRREKLMNSYAAIRLNHNITVLVNHSDLRIVYPLRLKFKSTGEVQGREQQPRAGLWANEKPLRHEKGGGS